MTALDRHHPPGFTPLIARLLAMLGTLFSVSLHVPPAQACSCAGIPSPRIALANSDLVFTGRVVQREDPDGTAKAISSGRTVWYTFKDVRVLKGASSDPMRVRSRASEASCGYGFEVGHSYLVYCRVDSSGPSTGLCTRTRELEEAGPDLSAIEEVRSEGDADAIDRAVVRSYVNELQSTDPADGKSGIDGLGATGHRACDIAIPALVERYAGSPAATERVEILHAVGRIGSPDHGGAVLVRSALRDPDSQVRTAGVVAAFSVLPTPELRVATDEALRDRNSDVRRTAIQCIGEGPRPWRQVPFDSTEVADRLLASMADTSTSVRYWGAAYLPVGNVRREATRDALLLAQRDPDPETRRVALGSLGELRPRDAAVQRALIEATGDSLLARTAVHCLGQSGPLRSETLNAMARLARRQGALAGDVLRGLGQIARETPAACDTMAALWSADLPDGARQDLIVLLQHYGCDPGRYLDVLGKAMRHGDARTREVAAIQLAKLPPEQDPGIARLLILGLDDASARIRKVAAERLGSVTGAAVLSAIPRLKSIAVSDSSAIVRLAARHSLDLLGAPQE